jgi:hypothetical protein
VRGASQTTALADDWIIGRGCTMSWIISAGTVTSSWTLVTMTGGRLIERGLPGVPDNASTGVFGGLKDIGTLTVEGDDQLGSGRER